MTSVVLRSLILASSVVGCVGIAGTQPSPQDDEILVAAARYIQSQYPTAKRLAIHPRIYKVFPAPRSGTFGDLRAPSRTETIAQRLGATVHTSLAGFDLIIALSDPVVDESGVSVHATISRLLAGSAQPRAATRDIILTLTRGTSGWLVTGEWLLRIT
jgi:hypothetical protein